MSALFFVFLPNPSLAQGLGGFDFSSFVSEIEVAQDGSARITETLSGDFYEERHGLFRFIPDITNDNLVIRRSLRLKVRDVQYNGQPVEYEVNRENSNQVIKIGNANKLIFGPFEYVITYDVGRAILFGEDKDVFYWNVTGEDWSNEVFPKVTAIVNIEGTNPQQISHSCFTGPTGSIESNCKFGTLNNKLVAAATDPLTIRLEIPKGVIKPPTKLQLYWWFVIDNYGLFSLILIPIVAIWTFVFWLKHGVDPRIKKTIIAQYDPPKGLTAVETGMLEKASLAPNHFSSVIVDLAVRGYIIIKEEKGVFNITKFSLIRTEKVIVDLPDFYKYFLENMFLNKKEIDLSKSVGVLFTKLRKELEEQVFKTLIDKNLQTPDSLALKKKMNLLAVVTPIVSMFLLIIIGSANNVAGINFLFPFAAVFVIGIILSLLAKAIPQRTSLGTEALWEAKGFRLFLNKAERYRIFWQERENIFETFLPYAIAFGVSKKWANAFKDVGLEKPSWFQSNAAVFSVSTFSSSMSSFSTSAGSVSTPSSSGGGSSGGGSGGGGGGSW